MGVFYGQCSRLRSCSASYRWLKLAPVRRIARITIGFALLGFGLILAIPGVPGPGIAVVILGLIILAEHFAWARHALHWAKTKAEQLRDKVTRRERKAG